MSRACSGNNQSLAQQVDRIYPYQGSTLAALLRPCHRIIERSGFAHRTWKSLKTRFRFSASSFCPIDAHTSVYTTSAPFTASQTSLFTVAVPTPAAFAAAASDHGAFRIYDSILDSLRGEHEVGKGEGPISSVRPVAVMMTCAKYMMIQSHETMV